MPEKTATRSSKMRLGVDAGNIGVLAYERAEKKLWHAYELFDLGEAGKYRVKLDVSGTWNGRRQKTATLETTTGKFAVGDLCYMFDKGWLDFLDETKYLADESGKFWMAVNTGGDGSFSVRVKFTKVD